MSSPTKAEATLSLAFSGGGRFAPDEERLVFLEIGCVFSFIYGELRGLGYNFLKEVIRQLIFENNS